MLLEAEGYHLISLDTPRSSRVVLLHEMKLRRIWFWQIPYLDQPERATGYG